MMKTMRSSSDPIELKAFDSILRAFAKPRAGLLPALLQDLHLRNGESYLKGLRTTATAFHTAYFRS